MKRFDILIVGDFRFQGGTSVAIAHELRALRSTDHSVGLYHVNSAFLRAKQLPWHQDIVAEVNRGGFHVLSECAAAEAGVIFLHSPWILPQMIPTQLRARVRILVAHHPPVDARGRLYYDPLSIERDARRAFGGDFVWAPISPVCRDAFDAAGLTFPRLRMDWTNLIFVDDWGAARSRLIGDTPVIGRHSQPRPAKWPDTRDALLEVFPSSGEIQVKLMGLSEKMKRLIGERPGNWQTMEPNEISVREFLGMIDFFVYFHHSKWLEAFGRTIAEAAAAGCIAIVPPYLKRTFGDACLYCEPGDARSLVRAISTDLRRFAELSARGGRIIDERFGPSSYLARLDQVMQVVDGKSPIDEIVERPRRGSLQTLRGHANRARFYWRAMTKARSRHILKRTLKKLRRKGFHRTRETN
jgi:hypothetical protein